MAEVAERAGVALRMTVLFGSAAMAGACLWWLGNPEHTRFEHVFVAGPTVVLATATALVSAFSLLSERRALVTTALWLAAVTASWFVFAAAGVLLLAFVMDQVDLRH